MKLSVVHENGVLCTVYYVVSCIGAVYDVTEMGSRAWHYVCVRCLLHDLAFLFFW